MAEGVGFEPTALKIRAAVFKTASIDRSDTPPGFKFYPQLTSKDKIADSYL
jgi:hypothetical protein